MRAREGGGGEGGGGEGGEGGGGGDDGGTARQDARVVEAARSGDLGPDTAAVVSGRCGALAVWGGRLSAAKQRRSGRPVDGDTGLFLSLSCPPSRLLHSLGGGSRPPQGQVALARGGV